MGLRHAKCSSDVRLDGKTIIVTGCNTGIGKPTVLDFYKRGARVIMACRSLDKANQAIDDIQEACKGVHSLGVIIPTELDLSSLDSVRSCANKLLDNEDKIDILVNNAGISLCPKAMTQDGFEMQIGTNHFGHFLLTLLLLPKIIQSSPSRIVIVASNSHTNGVLDCEDLNFDVRGYHPIKAYEQSKLANVLFANELARRLKDAKIDKVTVYSLHPGVIATDILRNVDKVYFKGLRWLFGAFGIFMKNCEQGAQTTIHCAVDEQAGKETGLYYAECQVTEPSKKAKDMDVAKRLWEKSLGLVGLDENYNPFSF